jgi:hypothetical protein
MERWYVKDTTNNLNHVGYLQGDDFFHALGYQCTVDLMNLVPATATEIMDYVVKEKQQEEQRIAREKRESELLALCGLKHEDFIRFRGVDRKDNILHVYTRENGIGERSSEAIKNPNYIESCPDDYDSTYEWYEFNIPKASPIRGRVPHERDSFL